MRKLLIPSLIFVIAIIFLFFGPNHLGHYLASLSSVITAWVTINPLEVDVTCPKEVIVDRMFIVRAKIENKGEKEIEEAEAEIFLPEELELVRGDKEQEIGVLSPKRKKFIFWVVSGKEIGNYIISVKVSGELEEKPISSEDSTMVKIIERRFPPWRYPFDFFRERFGRK